MLRFILADLRRLWPGAIVVVALTALAVALGTAVTLQERALRLGSARASEKFDLVIGAPGSETQLVLSSVFLQPADLPLMPGSVLGELARDPRVAWAAPVGFGDFFQGHPIIGTARAVIGDSTPGLAEGRIFAAEGEAVIGSAVGLPLEATITPMHGQPEAGGHAHDSIGYRITGRLRPTGTAWDRAILVPIQAVWHAHALKTGQDSATGPTADAEAHGPDDPDHADPDHDGPDHDGHGLFDADAALDEDWDGALPGLPAILVKPRSIADAYRLRQDYRQRPETLAVFPAEVLTELYAMMGDARTVLAAIALGTQTLVAASLLLVAIIHVGQRRSQIGALRALGAPRAAIFGIVWGELCALLLIGMGLGLGLGYLAAQAISQGFAMRQGFPLPVGFGREDLGGLGLLGLAGLLVPLIPALLAWRQPPLAALRG